MSQELTNELSKLRQDEIRIIQKGVTGQDVDRAAFDKALNKLPLDTIKQLNEIRVKPPKMTEGEKRLTRALEAQTPLGQAKQVATDAGKAALGAVVEVGEFIDKYTGAPARQFIGTLQETGDPIEAISKGATQIGADPSLAPTGKEIATELGASTEPMGSIPLIGTVSPAGVAGLAIDILADPTNIIPVSGIAKVGKQIGKATKDIALKGTKRAADEILKRSPRAAQSLEKAQEILVKFEKGLTGDLKRADDFDDLMETAELYNIDINNLPATVEFGPDHIITSMRKVQGQLGDKRVLGQFEDFSRDVNRAWDDLIIDISDQSTLTYETAGQFLRDSYNKKIEQFFDSIDFTYDSVRSQLGPGFHIQDSNIKGFNKFNSFLNGLEKKAKGILIRGISKDRKEAANLTLDAVEKLRLSDGNYKQFVEQMQEIGKEAWEATPVSAKNVPPDKKVLRDIYTKGTDLIKKTVDVTLGKDVGKALRSNNEKISSFLSQKGIIEKTMLNPRISDENLFSSLILHPDSTRIGALSNFLDIDDWNQLKGLYVESLYDLNKDGDVLFSGLLKKMQKPKNMEKAMLILEPDEIEALTRVAYLGDRMGSPILNPSKTGVFLSLTPQKALETIGARKLGDTIVDALENKARTGQFAKLKRPTAQQVDPIQKAIDLSPLLRDKFTLGFGAQKVPQVISVQEQNKENAISRRLQRGGQ
jgi:hypothetical protein